MRDWKPNKYLDFNFTIKPLGKTSWQTEDIEDSIALAMRWYIWPNRFKKTASHAFRKMLKCRSVIVLMLIGNWPKKNKVPFSGTF